MTAKTLESFMNTLNSVDPNMHVDSISIEHGKETEMFLAVHVQYRDERCEWAGMIQVIDPQSTGSQITKVGERLDAERRKVDVEKAKK